MGGEFNKEAYEYHNYIGSLKGAKVKILPIPGIEYVRPYSQTIQKAYDFLYQKPTEIPDFDDFFQTKLSHAKDKVDLIIGEVNKAENLSYGNLQRLYADLLRVDQMRAEIPYPQSYMKDRAWSDLNKSELRIREQIRGELRNSMRDISFVNKDLRSSLLEYKLQNHKRQMLGGGLDSIMESDDSHEYER